MAETPTSGGLTNPRDLGGLVNDLFLRQGMSAWWYPMALCSCWGDFMGQGAMSAAPDPSCPICGGRGLVSTERVVVNHVLFTKMAHATIWTDAGVTFEGTAKLSVPRLPDTERMYGELAFRDVVIPLDFSYEAPFPVVRGRDRLPYTPVSVTSVTYGSTSYRQGTDFRADGRSILWVGNQPPQGATYLVRATYHPVYTLLHSLATLRNYAHLNWPRSYVLQELPNIGDLVIDDAP